MAERLGTISRPFIWVAQISIFAVSGIIAFLLRFDPNFPPNELSRLVYALTVSIAAKTVVFRIARLDRGWWRFMSLNDLPRLAMGNLVGSLLGAIAILWFVPDGLPNAVYILDLLVCFMLTVGVRLAARAIFEASRFKAPDEKERTLIYLVRGEAGISLLAETRNNSSLP